MDNERFRELVLDNQTLQISQSLRLDGKLGVNAITEVINVTSKPNVVGGVGRMAKSCVLTCPDCHDFRDFLGGSGCRNRLDERVLQRKWQR